MPIDKDYRFETDEGERLAGRPVPRALAAARLPLHVRAGLHRRLPGLLGDRRRLQRLRVHLANHDVMLWAVSRAPLEKLQALQAADGLELPVGLLVRQRLQLRLRRRRSPRSSSVGRRRVQLPRGRPCGRRREDVRGPFDAWAATTGTDWATYTRERPGMSAFALEDGVVYHTYSAYARGLDGLWGMYQWLDRAPLGRNEARGPETRSTGSAATTSTAGKCSGRSGRLRSPLRGR